jgi:hypothetical protein
MKNFKLLLILLLTSSIVSCEKDDIYDLMENVQIIDKEITESVVDDTESEEQPNTNEEQPNTSPIPQTIYSTSFENHERNSGWYSTLIDNVMNGGTSHAEFHVGFSYLDYDLDGDLDIFLVTEKLINTQGHHLADSEQLVGILLNNGTDSNGNIRWTFSTEMIDHQPRRIYRKLTSADIDNDGDLDIVAFNAEDPYEGNGFRIMGGVDIFRFKDGKFTFEEIYPYSEGMPNFFHNGALADVNNDGWVDIIGGTVALKIFLNDGTGNFKDYYIPTHYDNNDKTGMAGIFSTEVFDINQDGYVDLLLGTARNSNSSFYWDYYGETGGKKMLKNHSEIFFGKPEYPYFNETASIIIEGEYDFSDSSDWLNLTFDGNMDWTIDDFDNDGDYDFLVYLIRPEGSRGSMVSYYENNNNTFTAKTKELFGYNQEFILGGVSWIKTYDINNDGKLEILIEESPRSKFNAWVIGNDGKYYQQTIKTKY